MSPTARKTYAFTLVLATGAELTFAIADALYEAGCDDATPMSSEGVVSVLFDREAVSLGDAVGSAIKDVERAGLTVARVVVETETTSVA